jgi:hypothetical protein
MNIGKYFAQVEISSGVFVVNLVKIGDKNEVKTKEQSDKILADLEKSEYKVADVRKRQVTKNPFPPFTTSTMTQAGSRIFGWSSKRTMSTAQKLYEEGLITYHRTDSLNLNAEAVSKARDFIKKEYGEKYLPEKPKFYKTTSKVAQEAHEAIRPTNINVKIQLLCVRVQNPTDKLHYQSGVPTFSLTHRRYGLTVVMPGGNNFGIALPKFHTSDEPFVSHAIVSRIRISEIDEIDHADPVHNSVFQADIFPSSTLFLLRTIFVFLDGTVYSWHQCILP